METLVYDYIRKDDHILYDSAKTRSGKQRIQGKSMHAKQFPKNQRIIMEIHRTCANAVSVSHMVYEFPVENY